MKLSLCLSLLLLPGLALAAPKPATKAAAPKPAPKLLVPKDGMVLKQSATLKPGVYALPHGITLGADNIALDGNGAMLIGNGTGQAVHAQKHDNVTVKNLRASRYRWGIRIEDAKNATVQDCHIRETSEEVPADGVWLNIWTQPKDAYGAGIILLNVTGGTVSGNDLQHQQNGVSLYNCTGLTVEKNNASFESGWGIHLFGSSENVIQDNLADWCDRIHKRGDRYYYPGADAAGMLVIWNSSRNIVRRNMFRGGGDGVFIAGYHPEYGKLPCNDNVFEDNDGSYSPNNAFESTFCEGNVFRNNRANMSNYGFWLGYSWKNVVEGNEIRRNRIAGIAIEHGHHNALKDNRISGNVRGIALWARADAGFLDQWPDSKTSAFYDITGNTFTANGIGLLSKLDPGRHDDAKPDDQKPDPAARPHDYTVRANTFYGNEIGMLTMGTDRLTLQGNRFQANTAIGLRVEDGQDVLATGNAFADEPAHAWADRPVTWTGDGPEAKGGASNGTPTGNYWDTATPGQAFTPSGPNPGTDTAPLNESPVPLTDKFPTEMDMLRATPR